MRTLIKQDVARAFEEVDVIITPTTPSTAFRIGEKRSPLEMYLSDLYTATANLSGICALSLPCGYDSRGLPVGLQIMGNHFREELIFQVAHVVEESVERGPSVNYDVVIGLEIHVALLTDSKFLCGCSTAFGAPPNTQCCPVCLGLPGTLPVVNEKAVEYGVKAGLALNCEVHCFSRFDRKNYFYPDLPKAYQITQDTYPLCTNGFLEYYIDDELCKTAITRLHLEEEAGKLIHSSGSIVDSGVFPGGLQSAGIPSSRLSRHLISPAPARRASFWSSSGCSCAALAFRIRRWKRVPCAVMPTSL